MELSLNRKRWRKDWLFWSEFWLKDDDASPARANGGGSFFDQKRRRPSSMVVIRASLLRPLNHESADDASDADGASVAVVEDNGLGTAAGGRKGNRGS